MGMFDDLELDARWYPLQDAPDLLPGTEFQTKDLECQLCTYRISEDGRLLLALYHYEPEEGPSIIPGLPRVRYVFDGEEEIPYHGDVTFYAVENPLPNVMHRYSFTARFTEGRLTRIWCLESPQKAAPNPVGAARNIAFRQYPAESYRTPNPVGATYTYWVVRSNHGRYGEWAQGVYESIEAARRIKALCQAQYPYE